MNQKIKRLLCSFLCVFLLMGLFVSAGSIQASAESVEDVPYTNYTYWENGGTKIPVATKAVYQAFDTLTGEECGIGSFKELQYMSVYDGILYFRALRACSWMKPGCMLPIPWESVCCALRVVRFFKS